MESGRKIEEPVWEYSLVGPGVPFYFQIKGKVIELGISIINGKKHDFQDSIPVMGIKIHINKHLFTLKTYKDENGSDVDPTFRFTHYCPIGKSKKGCPRKFLLIMEDCSLQILSIKVVNDDFMSWKLYSSPVELICSCDPEDWDLGLTLYDTGAYERHMFCYKYSEMKLTGYYLNGKCKGTYYGDGYTEDKSGKVSMNLKKFIKECNKS